MVEENRKISEVINSVNLALDRYDDIFSDFDPSPYSKRTISDDFTREIQKRYTENKKGKFEVIFSLPKQKRDSKLEETIKKRIKEHYKNKVKETSEKIEKFQNKGMHRIFFGVSFVFLGVLTRIYLYSFSEFIDILISFFEIAGWFSIWTGFEYYSDRPSDSIEQREFYKKFYDAGYIFISEEEILQEITQIKETGQPNEKR
ncbi:MAG: hypothetical protein WC501_00735 [Candidatus Micrarchaeia archaeon]